MARGKPWWLVRVATLGAKGLGRASQLWEVGRALIQVGQRDCVLLTDWPVKLSLQSWTLIVREGQREQGFRLTHKLVHVTLTSHLWRERGWVSPRPQLGDAALLWVQAEAWDLSLPGWFPGKVCSFHGPCLLPSDKFIFCSYKLLRNVLLAPPLSPSTAIVPVPIFGPLAPTFCMMPFS